MKHMRLGPWPALSLCCVVALTSPGADAKRAPPPPPPPPPSDYYQPPPPPSVIDNIVADARAAAMGLGMPPDRQELVLRRLDTALRSGKVVRRTGSQMISGVFAYQFGEGGFLVKVKRGKGLVRFPGQPDRPFLIKGASFGASIGGSSEWGVGLVVGLQRIDYFGGDYRGRETGATAAEAGANVAVLLHIIPGMPETAHDIYLVGAGTGLSAGAARAKLTLLLQ